MRKMFVIVFLISISNAWLWTPPQNLGISGVDDINPQACRVHVIFYPQSCLVWQTKLNGNWDIFSRFSNGATWNDTMRITTDLACDSCPSVAYDFTRDCFWCAWQNNSVGNWDIYVSQSDVNAWSIPYQLTTSSADDELPSVYVNLDTVWLVWQRIVTDSTNIYSTYYDGTTWATPSPITNDANISNIHPKINGRYDHPFLVWQRENDIYYSEFLSGAWQPPQPITTDPNNDHYPELMSSSEISGPPSTYGIKVIWQSDRDGNYEIYTTAYDTLDVHYRMTFNDSTDITPSPLFFTAFVEQLNPAVTAFSTNRNGDYDIYTHFDYGYGDTIVPVDTNDSEDILAVTTGDGMYVWTLWQTNRNTDWDIYGSSIFVGGVEESNAYDFKAAAKLTINPNPFREITEIRYQMQDARCTKQDISLKIYDVSGRLVRSFNLASDFLSLASIISWDGTDIHGQSLPQGVYFVQLKNKTEVLTEKVVLTR
ncbi:T9SS type A sorting domain-containing protein [candidate division WOR-3 bacterium]|nr:T9SS type A sorting domain-containing protein [candidate division WOR-3 bacterium]